MAEDLDRELLEWLEGAVKTIFERKVKSMAFVGEAEDGEMLTGYYGADAQDKAMFASNIQSDVVMDIIEGDAEKIKELLREPDEDD